MIVILEESFVCLMTLIMVARTTRSTTLSKNQNRDKTICISEEVENSEQRGETHFTLIQIKKTFNFLSASLHH